MQDCADLRIALLGLARKINHFAHHFKADKILLLYYEIRYDIWILFCKDFVLSHT